MAYCKGSTLSNSHRDTSQCTWTSEQANNPFFGVAASSTRTDLGAAAELLLPYLAVNTWRTVRAAHFRTATVIRHFVRGLQSK